MMRKKKTQQRHTEAFRYQSEGKTYPASFTVEDGGLSFSTIHGSKQAALRHSPAKGLLAILLSELGLELVDVEAAN